MISPKSSTSLLETVYSVRACSRTIVDDFGEIIYFGERTGLHDAAVAQSASRRLRSRLWMISPKSSTSQLEVVYSVLACSRAIVDDFGEIIYFGERIGLSDAAVAQSTSRRLRSRVWMISPKSSTSQLETVYSVLACSGAIVDDFGEIIYLGGPMKATARAYLSD